MSIRKYFFSGIAVIFPIFITVYIFALILRFTDGLLGKYVNSFLFNKLGYKIPGLGILLTIGVIIGVGFLSTNLLGRGFLPFIERVFIKIPFVSHIYLPAKQLAKFFFGHGKQPFFKKVVLIPYPNPSTYSIGFLTNEGVQEFNAKTGRQLVSVLVSTPPSPFSGPLIFLPKEQVIILDISIEQALKFVVSGGVVSPDLISSYNQ